MNACTARACANIALAKYWGKRPTGERVPAVPSISVTLAGLSTVTRVELHDRNADELWLGGERAPEKETARVSSALDRLRALTGETRRARVDSINTFPSAAGLASSASAFAALTTAAGGALGLSLSPETRSDLARRMSVSAARSLFGGFVELPCDEAPDGTLSARPLAPGDAVDLAVLVAVTSEGPKAVGSTDGMARTEQTSPYYESWVRDAKTLTERIRTAILDGSFSDLGVAAELSALRMHASAIAAEPPVLYWKPATIAVVAEIAGARARGELEAFCTIDAGPSVKVLVRPADEDRAETRLLNVPGVLRVIRTRPGPPPTIYDGAPDPRDVLEQPA